MIVVTTLATLIITTLGYQQNHQHSMSRSIATSRDSDSIKTNVLIIGAGLSGLEAARLLQKQGVRTIVLEGRNRIGGRIWSIPMKNNHVFDAGAAWLHGLNGSIPGGLWENPLWKIVQEAGIKTRATDLKDIHVFNHRSTTSDTVHQWFERYLEYAQDKYRDTDSNETLLFLADEFSRLNNFTDEDKRLFYSYLHISIENDEGANLDEIDGRGLIEVTSSHYGDEHVFHETGYISVINHLAKDVRDIRLNQIVKKIDYTNSTIQVYTSDNHIYEAQYILLTVPLGILKRNAIEFVPELPQWKRNAINRIGFGVMNKIILLWDQAWWTEDEYFFQRVAERRSEYPFWVNANKWNDRPALVCYVVGNEAEEMEKLTDSQIIQEILATLKNMYQQTDIPNPIDTFITRWRSDPFTYGGYSYISNKQRRQDPGYLAEPVSDRLLFAGEATVIELYGFAHGALMSGRREVTRLLYVYEVESEHDVGSMVFSSMNLVSIILLLITVALNHMF